MSAESDATDGAAACSDRPPRPLDITVLMGGPSSERDVSLLSGAAIADALERRGHCVTRADISPKDTSALGRSGIELVFIALHGEFGESGEVQQLCELRGLAYTGSSPQASELAMDKAAAKQLFKRAGLDTPDWCIIEDFHTPQDYRRWLAEEFGPPVVVKPVAGGSSIDITIARDEAVRDEAVDSLMDKYGRVLVEKLVTGRELTVGILGEQALPVLQVVPSREFYDYTAKYADGAGTQYLFEHGLDAPDVAAVQAAALTAHRSLDCRDLSRVDIIREDNGRLNVLEINTIPGFTSHSLVPMAAERAGIGFDELVDRIAAMAMRRWAGCVDRR